MNEKFNGAILNGLELAQELINELTGKLNLPILAGSNNSPSFMAACSDCYGSCYGSCYGCCAEGCAGGCVDDCTGNCVGGCANDLYEGYTK